MKKLNDFNTYEVNPFISQDYKYGDSTGGYTMKIANDYQGDTKMVKEIGIPEISSLNGMRDKYIDTISDQLHLTKSAHNLLSYLLIYSVGFYEESTLFRQKKARQHITHSWVEQEKSFKVSLDQDDFNARYEYENRFSMLSAVRELLEKKVMVRVYGTNPHEYFLHPAIFDTRNLATISVNHSIHSPDKQELEEDVERLQEEFQRKKDLLTKM